MTILHARSFKNRKGQIKIQEMAFVLIAVFILFVLAILFYFSVKYSSLKVDTDELRKQEVLETVRKMSASPEFSWEIEDCQACVDMDKALLLKNRKAYEGFWKNVAFLQFAKVYPDSKDGECSAGEYPDCSTITLIKKDVPYQAYGTYVALCYYDAEKQYPRCGLGKIIMGFETVQ